MIQIFRSILISITGSINRLFTAFGRADETVAGKMYQHYGFRSTPPADTELATIKFGNNIISVAENDGAVQGQILPNVGETALYSQPGDYIYLRNNEIGLTNTIDVQSSKGISITAGSVTSPGNLNIEAGAVYITGEPSTGISQYLATEIFYNTVVQWFAANAKALSTAGCTPFVPPTQGLTQVLKSE